jgi:ankyrin repeat protein
MAGATPFFLAARYAEAPTMRLLLDAGADATAGLKDATTPLMVAAGMNTLGLGRIGKDRRDRDLDSAENDIARSQDEDIRQYLNSGIDAVKICVEQGADVNAVNATTGDTALHAAARHGFKSVIQFLVAHGARSDIKNKQGQTPVAQLQAVLKSDADTDIKNTAVETIAFIKTLDAAR